MTSEVAREAAPRAACVLCGNTGGRRRRRGACIRCYRKFRECGVELPLPTRPPPDLPRWLVDRMTPAQRVKLRVYLGELADRETAPEP